MNTAALLKVPDPQTLTQLPLEQLVGLIVQQQSYHRTAATGNQGIDAGGQSTQGQSKSR